jgi:hypothetical protein
MGISAALTVHYAGHTVVTLVRINIQTHNRILSDNPEESSKRADISTPESITEIIERDNDSEESTEKHTPVIMGLL